MINIPSPPDSFSCFFSRAAVSGSFKKIRMRGIRNITAKTAAAGSVLPLMKRTMTAARLK